ncbi:hypothetical protein BDDG_13066 [Blastomyces dermatitidis ATCC 18188]|uniref:Uncharacterized protein n=1 Tax=Ajellomyces dermatitidis (strain ATCC 18188 / CBS 674.68) TaxID=653446 RepID=A0A0J9EUG6_AJEDA|nr:hypothetical protein BDDG_13066 [Blastomyces dermatitidis ATCC 18188]
MYGTRPNGIKHEIHDPSGQSRLRYTVREKLQIKLLRVTVSEIKLFLSFSLNDHTESYATVLTERRGDVATVMKKTENELNTDTSADRRDDISLQSIVTFITAVREAEEDVTMRAVLPQLIDTAVFNLAFLTVMKAAAAL